MNEKDKNNMQKMLAFIGGLLTAAVVLYHPSAYDWARSFDYKGRTVISTIEEGRMDQIYISLPSSRNSHTNLNAYLKTFTNKQERLAEESAILNLLK